MISASHFLLQVPRTPTTSSFISSQPRALQTAQGRAIPQRETNIRRFHISSRYLLCGQRPSCPVILIAAATGVTQMRSIARWLLAQPEAPTVSLFWGTLTPEELYLSNELDSLAASDHRFQYFPVVSQRQRLERKKRARGRCGD